MIWIKLRDKLPINSDREVRVAYADPAGEIRTNHWHDSTGWVLNRYAALYGTHVATADQHEVVWQYHDIATSH